MMRQTLPSLQIFGYTLRHFGRIVEGMGLTNGWRKREKFWCQRRDSNPHAITSGGF